MKRLAPIVLAACTVAEVPAETGKTAGVTPDVVTFRPAPTRAVPASEPAPIERQALADAMRRRLTFRSSRRDGRAGYQVKHCRTAPRGCAARLDRFAAWFLDLGKANGVDPWLLAAMAMKESSLNPYAVGGGGERGVLQIHPRNRKGRRLRWLRDEEHRKRCRSELGACQREVIAAAAHLLSRALDTCGTERRALSAYNSGRCEEWNSYPRRVLRERDRLLELAKEDW